METTHGKAGASSGPPPVSVFKTHQSPHSPACCTDVPNSYIQGKNKLHSAFDARSQRRLLHVNEGAFPPVF